MKSRSIIVLSAVIVVGGCNDVSQRTPGTPLESDVQIAESPPEPHLNSVDLHQNMDRTSALDVMSRIQPGMTFAEIRKIIPIAEAHTLLIAENGGVFYDIPISSEYLIQLRFAHPMPDQSADEVCINYSPRLRDRISKEFISGVEETW